MNIKRKLLGSGQSSKSSVNPSLLVFGLIAFAAFALFLARVDDWFFTEEPPRPIYQISVAPLISNDKDLILKSDSITYYSITRDRGKLDIDTYQKTVLVSLKTRDGGWTPFKEWSSGNSIPFPFHGSNFTDARFKSSGERHQIHVQQIKR